MRARGVLLENQIFLVPVLTKLTAACDFEKLRVSFTKSISSWTARFCNHRPLGEWLCQLPSESTRLDEQAAHRELNANILSAGKPSDYSTQILERTALGERFRNDPQTVLAELNSGLGKPDERDRLFALSELSFAYAEESREPILLSGIRGLCVCLSVSG